MAKHSHNVHDLGLKTILFIVVLLGVLSLTISLSITFLNNYREQHAPVVYNCDKLGATHFVYFKNNEVHPKSINAKPCEVITFINQDKFRLLAFGRHNNHVSYNGIYEQPMSTSQSFNITLDKSGNYTFHDHYQEEISGIFSVE